MVELHNALIQGHGQTAPEWLAAMKEKAEQSAMSANWPDKKMEHWRHTPVSRIEQAVQSALEAEHSKVVSETAEIPDLDAYEFRFDGQQVQGQAISTQAFAITRFCDANSAQQESPRRR